MRKKELVGDNGPLVMSTSSSCSLSLTLQGHQLALPPEANWKPTAAGVTPQGPDPAAGARSCRGGLVCRI